MDSKTGGSQEVGRPWVSRRNFLKGGILTGMSALGMLVFKKTNDFQGLVEHAGLPRWQITVDGQVVQEGTLAPDKRKDLHVPVPHGVAHIVLDNGRIYVHEDNTICPKKICSLMGAIQEPGETIICKPNKMVIRLL